MQKPKEKCKSLRTTCKHLKKLTKSYMAFMSARGRATVARQDGELLDVSSVMDRDEREIEEAVS